jgi:hypothetical protein
VCWEFVIRTDERVATEYDLPPMTGDDASIVDEIAVELAVRGKQVPLTRLEKTEAVTRMAAAGRSPAVVAIRLRMNACEVGKLWPSPVELAVRGKRMQLTQTQKTEAVTRLAVAGRSAVVVAARLGMSLPEVVELWPTPVEAGGDVTATTQCTDQQVT